ncbi:gas vesicle protein GvpK [Methanosarcina sp.]|uniref:gas vesicle protein GvpK n=1 Tax=Methanosarcina sp. TaxID=2213 RepID=UPI002AB7FF3C|nr:gas vesicle protein GvpK [Methanosarcina sp.]MDY9926975.1 gas vesicle protein GvpK [Methanosarcina sp.]
MPLKIDEKNLKKGVLGLVVALVEIITELLEKQALLRIEKDSLSDEEIERLGEALADLNEALEIIKADNNLEDTVESVRCGLDEVVDDVVDKLINPVRWAKEVEEHDRNRPGKISLLDS